MIEDRGNPQDRNIRYSRQNTAGRSRHSPGLLGQGEWLLHPVFLGPEEKIGHGFGAGGVWPWHGGMNEEAQLSPRLIPDNYSLLLITTALKTSTPCIIHDFTRSSPLTHYWSMVPFDRGELPLMTCQSGKVFHLPS